MKKSVRKENPFSLKTGRSYRIRFKRSNGIEDHMDGYFTGYQLVENTISVLAFDGHFKLSVARVLGVEERSTSRPI